jgi:AraC-like DNA-binding protein
MPPTPSLDHWTSAFGLVAFLGGFIAPLLYWQAGQRRRQVSYVVSIVLLFSATLLYYVLWWSGYLRYVWVLGGLVEPTVFLFGPLFFFYLKDLAGQPLPGRQRLAHLLPFGLVLLVSLPYVVLPPAEKLALAKATTASAHYYGLFFRLLPWVALLQTLLYAVALHRLRPAFASLQQVGRWARWFSGCFNAFLLANLSYYVLVRLPFFNQSWDYGISLAMCLAIASVTVLAYVQPQVFQTNQPPELVRPAARSSEPAVPTVEAAEAAPTPSRYQNSGLPPKMAAHFAARLDELMHREQLYRQNDLRLDTLAERLGLSRHHLSQVLNEQLGVNFFEYVNARRIAEARELLALDATPRLNIIEVAYEVGFNNKVSFNKAFKTATGLTPSAYRLQALGNADRSLPATAPTRAEKG